MPRPGPGWLWGWMLLAGVLTAAPAAAHVYHVNDTADLPDASPGDAVCATAAGTCTLRAAVMEASTLASTTDTEADEILLPAGTYRLTRPHTPRPSPSSEDGDLYMAGYNPITLTGAGAASTIIEQTVEDRVIHVFLPGPALIQGVTIRGGRAHHDEREGDPAGPRFLPPRNAGGGIYLERGSLTLRSVVVTGNQAGGPGGGVAAEFFAQLALENTTVSDNQADTGGGISAHALDMTFSTVSGNEANACGGMWVDSASYAPGPLRVSIRQSRITANQALDPAPMYGGAIWPGWAGGICSQGGLSNYEAQFGGMTLEDTLVQGNVGKGGGGLYSIGVSRLEIDRSTFADNNAADGGGLLISGRGRIDNSTISDNRASGYGGGVDHEAILRADTDGRPLRSSLVVAHSTIAGNRALFAALFKSHVTNVTQLLGTILANDPTVNCSYTMDSIGSNLETGERCLRYPGPGDLPDTDPLLEPLADNGGATPTRALRPSSPAIDAYVSSGCPSFDQRLALRPAGAACDIGAYEADAVPFPTQARPPLAPGEVGGGSIRLVLSDGMFHALSDQGVSLEASGPADGKDVTWLLPSVAGFLGQTHTLLVERGGLALARDKLRFDTADWVLRIGPDGGKVWSYAGEEMGNPRAPGLGRFGFGLEKTFFRRGHGVGPRLRRASAGPLELFRLEPSGQDPALWTARLTRRAAAALRRRLKLRGLKPGAVFGTLHLDPALLDPKGDPLPPPEP